MKIWRKVRRFLSDRRTLGAGLIAASKKIKNAPLRAALEIAGQILISGKSGEKP